MPEGERLQKVLANAGLGSRREIEGWIAAGRVRVNGKPAVLGDRVGPDDRIQIGRRVVRLKPAAEVPRRVIAYHKPEGEVVTRSDPEGRPTVFRHLPPVKNGRWINIGRLDINSSGLLLFTSDGELANRLMHPSRQVDREYAVRVLGRVTPEMLDRLRAGVELDDGPARFESIVEAGGEGANRWYHVVIREGRQREVRRMWESFQGLRVSRLIRVRFGSIELGSRLRPGRSRDLTASETDGLLALAGIEKQAIEPRSAPKPHRPRNPPRSKRPRAHRPKSK